MLGILGGMGPLASAEFVKTLYELNSDAREQNAPPCVLYSDPGFPDRTDAILAGVSAGIPERLSHAIETLHDAGAQKIVIACITVHHFLPHIPDHLRRDVISLLDVAIDEILAAREEHLMFCTTGCRHAKIFQNHPRWKLADPFVVWPDEADQARIHEMIYGQVKANRFGPQILQDLSALAEKYRTPAVVAGCTEFHLIHKLLSQQQPSVRRLRIIDPLLSIAANLKRFMHGN